MKKYSCMIFIDILLLIGVVYLFIICSNDNKITYNGDVTQNNYNINHYIDTIYDHVILTTVCEARYYNRVSISTLEIDNFNK